MTIETDLLLAIQAIACGKPRNGAPLGGETARQIARDVLIHHGLTWPKQERQHHEPEPAAR